MADPTITSVANYLNSNFCSMLETFLLHCSLEEKERATKGWNRASTIGFHCSVRGYVGSVVRWNSKHPTPRRRFPTLHLQRKLLGTTGYLFLLSFPFTSGWYHNGIKNHWPAVCNHPTDYYSDYIRLREHHPQLDSSHHVALLHCVQIVRQSNNKPILSL